MTENAQTINHPAADTPGDVMLRMESVSKSYRDGSEKVWACRNVDLTVFAGELIWLRGVSGAGKSTLLMAGAGLTSIESGAITVGGRQFSNASDKDRANLRLTQVGIVFQEFLLIDEFTAEENVMLPLEAQGWKLSHAREESRRWLDVVGLGTMTTRRPAQLSGGQRQRVAVARALVGGKRLILADEPTGSLDSATTTEIFDLLRKLADHGVAVVVASHNPQFISYVDKTYDMKDGVLTMARYE